MQVWQQFTRLILLLLAVALSGCGPSLDQGEHPRRVRSYDPSKFEFPPNKGEKALIENIGQVQVATGAFNKTYNRKDLEAVLRASAISTIDYIGRLGVSMYAVPRPPDLAANVFFIMLSEPPSLFDHLWRQNANRGPGKGVLAGVYFDACAYDANCAPDQVIKPVVLVDEGGDRWTLVHEFMHYLFDARRKAEGRPDARALEPSLKQAVDDARNKQTAYASTRTESDAASALESYDNLVNLVYQFSVVRELEEVAVEYQLLREYSGQKLRYVPLNAARNAVWYMNLKRNETLELLSPLAAQLTVMKAQAAASDWTEARARAAKLLSFIDNFRSQSRSMISEGAEIVRLHVSDIQDRTDRSDGTDDRADRASEEPEIVLTSALTAPAALIPSLPYDCLNNDEAYQGLKSAIQSLAN